jgi:hypothetical protein
VTGLEAEAIDIGPHRPREFPPREGVRHGTRLGTRSANICLSRTCRVSSVARRNELHIICIIARRERKLFASSRPARPDSVVVWGICLRRLATCLVLHWTKHDTYARNARAREGSRHLFASRCSTLDVCGTRLGGVDPGVTDLVHVKLIDTFPPSFLDASALDKRISHGAWQVATFLNPIPSFFLDHDLVWPVYVFRSFWRQATNFGRMDQYEMHNSKGAEIPSYQQTDENDARVLENLGYKQQLNRKFGFMSSLGLTTTVMATCKFWATMRVILQPCSFVVS